MPYDVAGGIELVTIAAEEFRKLPAADVARWKPVVKKNEITLD